ncbi:MAG: hypothetical protein HPY55_07835 [Firmicutes bacterium]|nr:hypothetical protein [Bacillota bacterium]
MPVFRVSRELFAAFPEACFGVVAAEGIPPREPDPSLESALRAECDKLRGLFKSVQDVREHPGVAAWRDAFTRLGWNPNRFPSSIEALLSRLAKGGGLPSINNVVNGANVVSLRHVVPIGAHDIDSFAGDVEIRPSRDDDTFTPFGSAGFEVVPPGEMVYVSGNQIRTRRWVWRQSENGKITASSGRVFFPIDGFYGKTSDQVRAAREDLASLCKTVLEAALVTEFWVDAGSPEADLSVGV